MEEVAPGVFRVTFALPFGIDHVHCYLVASRRRLDGRRHGSRAARTRAERWARACWTGIDVVADLHHALPSRSRRRRRRRRGAHRRAGAAGRGSTTSSAVRAWGDGSASGSAEYMRRARASRRRGRRGCGREPACCARPCIPPADPQPVAEGDSVDGWEVLHLPGHADGHLVLLRDGVLIAGDTILDADHPGGRSLPGRAAEPAGDYLGSLRRIAELAPRVALSGHGEPVEDPAARAREIAAHHDQRLEQTAASLAEGPRSAYEASLHLFPEPLPAGAAPVRARGDARAPRVPRRRGGAPARRRRRRGGVRGRVILENGTIRTLDPALPVARALAIAGDEIAGGVGVHERALASPERVDLGGRCVVPGFTRRARALPDLGGGAQRGAARGHAARSTRRWRVVRDALGGVRPGRLAPRPRLAERATGQPSSRRGPTSTRSPATSRPPCLRATPTRSGSTRRRSHGRTATSRSPGGVVERDARRRADRRAARGGGLAVPGPARRDRRRRVPRGDARRTARGGRPRRHGGARQGRLARRAAVLPAAPRRRRADAAGLAVAARRDRCDRAGGARAAVRASATTGSGSAT